MLAGYSENVHFFSFFPKHEQNIEKRKSILNGNLDIIITIQLELVKSRHILEVT